MDAIISCAKQIPTRLRACDACLPRSASQRASTRLPALQRQAGRVWWCLAAAGPACLSLRLCPRTSGASGVGLQLQNRTLVRGAGHPASLAPCLSCFDALLTARPCCRCQVVLVKSPVSALGSIKPSMHPSPCSESYEVILVSPRNYFLYTPLLPAVATGTMEERSIVEPVRNLITGKVCATSRTPAGFNDIASFAVLGSLSVQHPLWRCVSNYCSCGLLVS